MLDDLSESFFWSFDDGWLTSGENRDIGQHFVENRIWRSHGSTIAKHGKCGKRAVGGGESTEEIYAVNIEKQEVLG